MEQEDKAKTVSVAKTLTKQGTLVSLGYFGTMMIILTYCKTTQRQLHVFMALLRVSRLRVSADPQVQASSGASTWGSAETLSRETRSSAMKTWSCLCVDSALPVPWVLSTVFCWETPQFFNSCTVKLQLFVHDYFVKFHKQHKVTKKCLLKAFS